MASTAVATRGGAAAETEVFRVARAFAASGYFKDTRDEAQALVRILAGREMGFGPFASMSGVHIIEGKPSVSAGLMATAVENSGRYAYSVEWGEPESAPTACAITFYRVEGGKRVRAGVSRFSVEDAKAAGLWDKGGAMWKKYTRNMLFSRAMSNGCRWYCAGVFGVGAVYTPEELGADVDEDGAPVQVAQAAPKGIRMSDVIAAENAMRNDEYPPVIRMVDPLTAEVEVPKPVERTVLDLKATLEWLQRLPDPDLYNRSQRQNLTRLVGRLKEEADQWGLELPPREGSDAAWAAVACMVLAERDDSQPF